MELKPDTKFALIEAPALFVLEGMEYYLVEFKMLPGVTQCTHREAKSALDASGHVAAQAHCGVILKLHELNHQGWIALFDCRENMNDRVGYFMGHNTGTAVQLKLANKNDGLCFYHLDHGTSGEMPALCCRKVP